MTCSVEGTEGRDQDSQSNYSYLIKRFSCTLSHILVIYITFLFQLQVCKLLESKASDLYLFQRVLNLGPCWVEGYLKLHGLQMAGSEIELKFPYAIYQPSVLYILPLFQSICCCITKYSKSPPLKTTTLFFLIGLWVRHSEALVGLF